MFAMLHLKCFRALGIEARWGNEVMRGAGGFRSIPKDERAGLGREWRSVLFPWGADGFGKGTKAVECHVPAQNIIRPNSQRPKIPSHHFHKRFLYSSR
jgi:hypothetical protein